MAVMLGKSDNSKSQVAAPRPYQKPNLVKGPLLANVTAVPKTVSGVAPTCWVARAAFGEADVRWLIFRSWLLDDAPLWFRRLYIRYGETVGTWVAARAGARRIVRALMMPAVNRKLRK
jgi:hypothetical protein